MSSTAVTLPVSSDVTLPIRWYVGRNGCVARGWHVFGVAADDRANNIIVGGGGGACASSSSLLELLKAAASAAPHEELPSQSLHSALHDARSISSREL